MENIWITKQEKKKYSDIYARHGMRLRFDFGVDKEVKRACLEFCAWLRQFYFFPNRVPIYIKNAIKIETIDGDIADATFFYPFCRLNEPYIRVATGDYVEHINAIAADNLLASYLYLISHELTHYFQWIKNLKLDEKSSEYKARGNAHIILNHYASVRAHP